MAFDEELADRVRSQLTKQWVHFAEKRMMGGLCFMVSGKMCLAVVGDQLMARLDPAIYDAALQRPGCKPMDFTGRPMRGFVFVEPEGIETAQQLQHWVAQALEFNPRAIASKKATLKARPANPRLSAKQKPTPRQD